MNNHIIDPTFFYKAIEIFSFDYHLYVVDKREVDDYGNEKFTYEHQIVKGSLQTRGQVVVQRKSGNTKEVKYDFYCKSLYRIKDGDIIHYKHMLLRVDSFHDYDEYGVRSCSLTMVQLSAYKDLLEYIKYIEGDKLV